MIGLLKIAFLALAIAFPVFAKATAQAPDIIILDGKEYALNTNPLGEYLWEQGWKPPKETVISTNNWRGYVAIWMLANDQLMLKDVTILIDYDDKGEHRKSILGDIFQNKTEVVADWYTGVLIIPDGEILEYVHMGYGSTYDHYQIIRVSAGHIVERLSISGSEFEEYRARKFDDFTKTDEYKKSLDDLLKKADGQTEEELRDFMKSFYAERYLSL